MPLLNTKTTQLPAPAILVLDDLHAIAAPEITSDLGFLLDNLSSRMHLVVSTRIDPPWPLGRLRAGGEMIELRIEDLRFTINEVTAFLNDMLYATLWRQVTMSVHTVRTHVKSIYGKLDVHSRMAAVLRAKELNLI